MDHGPAPYRRAPAAAALAALVLACAGCEKRKPADDARPRTIKTKSGIEMVAVPGGWFMMGGGSADQSDQPAHRVYVSAFHIDKYEVTQAEFKRRTGRSPSLREEDGAPVDHIRWRDAAAYCNARSRAEGLPVAYDGGSWTCDLRCEGYRLPTEAEWEYAARAGTTSVYFFGDDTARLGDYAWCSENYRGRTQAVGRRKPNPWGLYDVYGNVWEWCGDFYDEHYYRRSGEKDPTGPDSGRYRVVRGGSFSSRPAQCRSAYREYEKPAFTDACFRRSVSGFCGLRCVRRPRKDD